MIQSMLCKVRLIRQGGVSLFSEADGQQEILPYIAWLCPGSWYVGVIAVQTTGKRNKPLWVWKKLATVSSSPARFEDAVAVWGYRVRRLCPAKFPAIALPPRGPLICFLQVANQIFAMKRLRK